MSEPTQRAELHCPECGAAMVNDMTCWEMLGAILAWESQDPELMAEHFLTVASYNLQHPAQFTQAALAALQNDLNAHPMRAERSMAEKQLDISGLIPLHNFQKMEYHSCRDW